MITLAVVVALVAVPFSGAVTAPPAGPLAGPTTAFFFFDRGQLRVATRGPAAGTDEAPVDVEDPGTGRRTRARIGAGVIVQQRGGVAPAVAGLEVVVVKALMPSAGLWLVKSARAGEDGLALAARLAPLVDDGRLAEAYPALRLKHRRAAALSGPPDDARYASQFYFEDIGIEAAWALSGGDPGVVVAVVDNGCDLLHPDLADKLDPGHDVVDEDEDPSYAAGEVGNEHGTACTGLVAAITNNGTDIAGTCPDCRATCTRLLPGDSQDVPLDADVQAFAHALDDDVDVVSNSWGFVDAFPVPGVLAAAITEVANNGRGGLGAIVVFAAGNDARAIADDELLAVDGVIGVGAVNNLGELTQFSNTGRAVDVVAPTGSVTTDISGPDGEADGDVTVRFGGTSSAAPLVSGIAGLLLSLDPTLTADEVEALLDQTARQSVFATPDGDGHDVEYGFGLVQPAVALATLTPPEPIDDDSDDDDDSAAGAGCDCDNDKGNAAVGAGVVLMVSVRRRDRRRRPG